MRKMESLPANGSIIVLNTRAANGADGWGGGAHGPAGGGILAFHWRTFGGRGQIRRDGVEQGADADILGARAAEDGRDFAIDYGGMQRRAHFGVVESALVEIL